MIPNLRHCPTLKRYMTVLDAPNPAKQKESADRLKNSIKLHTNSARKLDAKFRNKVYREANPVFTHVYPALYYLCHKHKQLTKAKFDYETILLQNSIDMNNFLLKMVQSNPNIYFNAKKYIEEVNRTNSGNEEYNEIKKRKLQISRQISILENKTDISQIKFKIKNELINYAKDYDEKLNYIEPNSIDSLVSMFLRWHSSKTMIFPLANFIAFGDPKFAVVSIGEYASQVYKDLGITHPVHQAIVYTSIIRFLFDESYVVQSDLNRYKNANLEFLERCADFAKQSAKELKLSEDIKSYYTPGLPLSSMFKSKQCTLMKKLEFLTNPIDLMIHVVTALKELAQYFGSETGVLSFDDTMTLFLGLTSLAPPSNAVAIAKFCQKWHEVQISSVIKEAENFYIAAIDSIMKLDDIASIEED